MTLDLAPMTSTEYRRWLEPTIAAYAADKIASGEWPPAGATARSRRVFDELLPHGVATPDQHLFSAYYEGERVGALWLHISTGRDDAFIYDIAIDEERRGHGLGRALLDAAEAWAAKRGLASVSLHVFGTNTVARRLYESAGYEVTDVSMRKVLG